MSPAGTSENDANQLTQERLQVDYANRRELLGVAALIAASLGAGAAFGQSTRTEPTQQLNSGTMAQAPAPGQPSSAAGNGNAQHAMTTSATPQGGTIRGTVQTGATPLPGVAVTATNTLTGKKFATTTDIDGVYQMQIPRNGRYVVKTELMGFAPTTQEVIVNAAGENGGQPTQTAEFKMELASRVALQQEMADDLSGAGATSGPTQSTVTRVGRGTQALSVQNNDNSDTQDATAGQGNLGVQGPSLGEVASTDASSASESIAVTGQQGQINGLAGFSEDDLRNRIRDMQGRGFTNGDIAGAFMGAMQSGRFGPDAVGGPAGAGGPGGPGGGFGGPGGGFGGGRGGFGGGGFGGFRGFRGQNPNAWHGTVAYNGYNSALNARDRVFTGVSVPKLATQNALVASFTGTPYIPHLTKANPKQFVFLSGSENRTVVPTIFQTFVPTPAQRLGDLTSAFQAGRVLSGTVYDPATGLTYGNSGCAAALYAIDPNPSACIPQNELNQSALALLNYYPLPNVTSGLSNYNFQESFPNSTHTAQASARYNRSFGAAPVRGGGRFGGGGGFGGRGMGQGQNRNAPPTLRQSIAENFAYSHVAGATNSFNPQLAGKTETNGYNVSSSYTVGYGRFNNTATVTWNRSSGLASNVFTNGDFNPAIAAGIFVANPTIYNNPFYYGLPGISITGGVSGLSDPRASETVNQTVSISDFAAWNHNHHNMRFGFDFRRIHADSIGSGNALGSFTFSGYATQSPASRNCSNTCGNVGGSAFADFLLGLPQQTSVSAGLNKLYLRANAWDGYAQDDWRVRSNLTFNYGLRWEYFSPYAEKYNRLVNLKVTGAGSTLAVSTVCASAPPAGTTSSACQAVSPGTLVKPDKSMFSPRVAVAWQPKFKWTKNTVVRSSYGINYNTGQYGRFATRLALQQPFFITQTNTVGSAGNNTGCTFANMTLNHGFNCSTQQTQSTFGVNPNYRLGMVQAYNAGIQRTLPQGIVLNIDYTGAHAGNLDMVRAPNRTPIGVILPSVTQFTYEDSLGYQRSNALIVNLRNRMHKGVALGATYTYSHSIDNASSVGGSGSFIAQNDLDLAAEESNSSFDRRHQFQGNFVIEPPFGPNRAFFNKGGAMSKILDGYSISGNFNLASGGWATPLYALTANEVAAGASSLRPSFVPGQSRQTINIGPRTHMQWFNTSAFLNDPNQNYYGNVPRNSIRLPGTVAFNGSLSRTVSLGETRSIEFRLNANNALNMVEYSTVDTTLNSPTFGQVTRAAGMRSLTYLARFRF